MPIEVNLADGTGSSRHRVKISHNGELFVRTRFQEVSRVSANGTGTAFNLKEPKTNSNFIITGLIMNADKNVTASALVEVYEANSPTSITQTKNLITLDIPKNATVSTVPLLLKVTEGTYINAETDDATVNVVLLGYFEERSHLD